MIKIVNLFLAYNKEYDALSNINLHIAFGEKVAVVGDSESGKTTLLRTIAGLEPYYKGEIYIGSINLKKINLGKCFSVAYIAQKPVFFENKTVYENLKYVLKIRKVDDVTIDKKILNTLTWLNINSLQDIKIKDLKPFEKMLVQFARVSLRNVDLYLIDDVFKTLNSTEEEKILNIIKTWEENEKSTFLICTQKSEVAKKISSRIIKLKLGSIEE